MDNPLNEGVLWMKLDRESRGSIQRSMVELRGMAVAIALLSSIAALSPTFIDVGIGSAPVFSRPNMVVDKGPGWVESAPHGGPDVAASSNGTIHAIWSDNRIGANSIYHAVSYDRGITWAGEKRIDASPGGSNIAPSIAVDVSSGPYADSVYVTWQSGDMNQADIYLTRSFDGGKSWTVPNKLDTSSYDVPSVCPRVAVDSNGMAYVVFMDKRSGSWNVYMAKSLDGGASWSPDFQIYASANQEQYPSIVANGGMVGVAWEEIGGGGMGLRAATSADNGFTWADSQVYWESPATGQERDVAIDIDSRGVIHLAWISVDSSGAQSVMYSKSDDRGAIWSTTVKVDDVPRVFAVQYDSVSIAQVFGTIYVIWADDRNGDYDIFATWSADDGKTWGDGIANSNDVRLDDTDENMAGADDFSSQLSPSAKRGMHGVYAIWSDSRDGLATHAYFTCYEASEILFSEIRDAPPGLEQIEIVNMGGRPMDLAGWTLVIDAARYPLAALGIVPPMAYRTVGDTITSDLMIDISLDDEKGLIGILDGNGLMLDSVGYGQLGPAPDPVNGESISRVFSSGAYRDVWTRTTAPTFGSQNTGNMPEYESVLVINELAFNAANLNDRFIELFYKGSSPASFQGYTLVGNVVYPLPLMKSKVGTKHFAIRPASAGSLFNAMNMAGDNLYLYDNNGSLIDMVGWSSSHTMDMSMSRIPEGNGTSFGYDDESSVLAGWKFDQVPSLALVSIGPHQRSMGNVGDRLFYDLVVTNKEPFASYINIDAVQGIHGWSMTLLHSDGQTPLMDSPGDSDATPDIGLVAPNSSVSMVVRIDIPIMPSSSDSEMSEVRATVASDPMVSAVATLFSEVFPYEAPAASATPRMIYVDSAPSMYQPQTSVVRLTLAGKGSRFNSKIIQDTVIVMDSSGSMMTSDPANMRLAGAKLYVDRLSIPDMAAVVDFDDDAILVNGDHLSSDFAKVKANIDSIDSLGATNLYDSMRLANDELVTYGDPTRKLVQIMLTDGVDTTGHTDTQIISEAMRAASYGIKIFTIGLGNDTNELLLFSIADITGGVYLKAEKPEDLMAIFETLGDISKGVAGYDDDVTDDIPMVSLFLPVYLQYVAGSSSPPVAYVGQDSGATNLQWNLSRLMINETWTATFNIRSSIDGNNLSVLQYPESRVTYIRHDGLRIFTPFPETFIDVLPIPPRPDLTLTPADIRLAHPPPYYGWEPVIVNATIWNIGANSSGTTYASIHDGTPPAPRLGPDQVLGVLMTGHSQEVSVLWTPTFHGNHNICVIADTDNIVPESDEGNNVACLQVEVKLKPSLKPDYVPSLAAPASRTIAGLSIPVSFSILVANSGNGSASVVSTIAFANETGQPFSRFDVPPLAASTESLRFPMTWLSPSVPGTYRVIVYVDFHDDIIESNESNNIFAWIVEVVKGPETRLMVGKPNLTAALTFVTSSTDFRFVIMDRSGTGIRSTAYRIDYGSWVSFSSDGRFFLRGEGEHQIEWYSEDCAGNKESVQTKPVILDDTPPSTSVMIGAPKYLIGGNFVTSHTKLSLQAMDGGAIPIGLRVAEYRTWHSVWSDWSPYHVDFRLDGEDGARYLEYYSEDYLGNRESASNISLIVDNSPPEMTLDPTGSEVSTGTRFSIVANDGHGSGVDSLWHSANGNAISRHTQPFTLPKGLNKIVYKAVDNLGNSGELTRFVEVVDDDAREAHVSVNYKPAVAFVFSVVLLIAAAFSARRKPLRRWKGSRKTLVFSWLILMLPFVFFETLTGFLSTFLEMLRIPPLVGWGTGIDLSALIVGCSYYIVRAFRRRTEDAEDEEGEESEEKPGDESAD